jgi:hypothetical protein
MHARVNGGGALKIHAPRRGLVERREVVTRGGYGGMLGPQLLEIDGYGSPFTDTLFSSRRA